MFSLFVQVLTPLQGGIPQQTGVIIQPQQIVLAGNKVQQNTQVSTTFKAQVIHQAFNRKYRM